MGLSENTQHWIDRLRSEVAAVSGGDWPVVMSMQLAEVECAYGLHSAAKATLRQSLQGFDGLQPGAWSSLASRASRLCGKLDESELLEPEIQRGVDWMAQPELMQFQGSLPGALCEIAVQTGRAEVADQFVTADWPGRKANSLVIECRLAGWSRDAAVLKRLLPRIRKALEAAKAGPDHIRKPIEFWLARACVRAGLLLEATTLIEEFDYPRTVTDELAVALAGQNDTAAYNAVRDGWLENRISAFRSEGDNPHWASGAVRHAAETIRRLGDAEGYRLAVESYREAAAATPASRDWQACVVHCDLAVLSHHAGEAKLSAGFFGVAKRLFNGKEPGVETVRGGRSLMSSILSGAYRDVGEIDLALQLARKCTNASERRMLLVNALIQGGRIEAAEKDLAGLKSARERATFIGDSLLLPFRAGSSAEFIVVPPT